MKKLQKFVLESFAFETTIYFRCSVSCNFVSRQSNQHENHFTHAIIFQLKGTDVYKIASLSFDGSINVFSRDFNSLFSAKDYLKGFLF